MYIDTICIAMQLTVFAVFCCARITWTTGFFVVIGIGYGFVCFFSILELCSVQLILTTNVFVAFEYSLKFLVISRSIQFAK